MVDVLFMYEILIIQIWCQVCQVVIVSRTIFTLTLVSQGPLNLLKLLNSHISPLISSLINRSFDESLMPECLRIGKQTPVSKGGDNILSNYRPITVVNSIAKVFEKAVNARLTKYLDKFNLLTDNQFGF